MRAILPSDRVKTKEIMDYIFAHESEKPFTLATLPLVVYSHSMPDKLADDEDNVYKKLNVDIRRVAKCKALERKNIKDAWGRFIRALITALRSLPPHVGHCFRGIKKRQDEDVNQNYKAGTLIRWSSFTSSSLTMDAAFRYTTLNLPLIEEQGETYTWFRIWSVRGRRIDHFSAYDEEEVLFEPNTFFSVLNPEASADPLASIQRDCYQINHDGVSGPQRCLWYVLTCCVIL